MVWNTETEYLVTVGDLGQVTIGLLKRLFLLKRWHMIPPWGSHRRLGHVVLFGKRYRYVTYLWWYGITPISLKLLFFCFMVDDISTFCCLIPPHPKLFQGHDLRGSLHSERGRSGANSHETWMMGRPFLWKDATETCWQAWIVWLRNSPEGTALFCDYGKAGRVENMWWLLFKTSKKHRLVELEQDLLSKMAVENPATWSYVRAQDCRMTQVIFAYPSYGSPMHSPIIQTSLTGAFYNLCTSDAWTAMIEILVGWLVL